MTRIVKYFLIALLGFGMLAGCDSCFDDELTDKVDAPNFTLYRNTNYDVVLSSDTKGATIKYTLDGSDPKDSNTAIEGTELTIDFFTNIRAYAYKKGKRDSITVDFSLPRFGGKRKIFYNSDYTVKSYVNSSNDCNNKRKLEVFASEKGSDNQWFTYDDKIDYYKLYNYDQDTLKECVVYNDPGEDDKWFTSDDQIDKTYDVSISGNDYSFGGEYTEKFDDQMQLVETNEYSDGPYVYTYDGRKPVDFTDGAGNTLVYQLEDNQEYYYLYENNSDGKPDKKIKYLGYGTDTNFGLTKNSYNEDGTLKSSTYYWDNAAKKERAHYIYAYDQGKLVSETKYKASDKEKLRFWREFEYEDNGAIKRIDYFDKDEARTIYEEFVYNGDLTASMTRYQRPAVAYKSFKFDFEVTANVVDGGYFIYAGGKFDHEGDPIEDIVDMGEDEQEFIENMTEKVKDIIKNVELKKASVILNGKLGGNAKILVATYDNTINIVFEFNSYNDGDVIINGTIDKELTGTIDVSGELGGGTAAGNGKVYGELMIADANPDFTDEDYIICAYSFIELDDQNRFVKETEYDTPGSDGQWDTISDNSIKYIFNKTFSGDVLTEHNCFNRTEDVANLNYRIVYEESSGVVTKETVTRNYGAYGKQDSGSTNETLEYYRCWSHLWDIQQRWEIDWDDEYWNEDVDKKDRVEWCVE
ncbi:MAG TPA: chitobiase/beta-hexosaminidase C-terminal domain-containing protein [Spirochaetota bacterium]|nr:chitobiase/beta-hexosaminidase C-terminal domain-containing protein [Spirochaetota bacterium]